MIRVLFFFLTMALWPLIAAPAIQGTYVLDSPTAFWGLKTILVWSRFLIVVGTFFTVLRTWTALDGRIAARLEEVRLHNESLEAEGHG